MKAVVIRSIQVISAAVVLGIPLDLMVRGADSIFGSFFIRAMSGTL